MRRSAAADLLPLAREAARRAGVTRLADVTRLDVIGFPVWQAVRPMSLALSVHQGKGATDADAQLGALLEAVESDSAERFETTTRLESFDRLPPEERAPTICDFARDRARPPSGRKAVQWVEAECLGNGASLHVPFDLVSLDFTRGVPSPWDRGSNGIATGATRDEAIMIALHELIERDAVTEWAAEGMAACMESVVDPDTIPFGWFSHWRERIAAAGARLQVYLVPSVTNTPVFACEINDREKEGAPYRAIQGRGCHALPEIALFKALAEALQGRTTYIAGARDDLLPSSYRPVAAITVAFGLPPPPGMEMKDFARIADGPVGVKPLRAALERAGYDRAAIIDLSSPPGFRVVRAFVCGLGSSERRRRPLS